MNRVRPSPRLVRVTVLGFLGLAIVSRGLVHAIPAYLVFVASLPAPFPWLEQPLRWTLISAAALCFLHGPVPSRWARDLGFARVSLRAIGLSVLAGLPLLMGPLLLGASLRQTGSRWFLVFTATVWPLGEELLYRGFAFGRLIAYGGLRFWPAALLTGLVFGVVHLGQAAVQRLPMTGQLGTVLIVALGGFLFSWLFARWGRSIWPSVVLHGLLNLGWALWDLDPSPLGTVSANALRALSVTLAVGLTLRYAPQSVTPELPSQDSPLNQDW